VIELVPAELPLLDAAIASDEQLALELGRPVAPGWATFTEALPRVREQVAGWPDGARWGPRFFLAGEPSELVGWGGFKGPPREGVVELGYEIAASHRERGLATAVARAMVAEAFADPAVTTVIAHTLPERNASNRVLEKAGFEFDREAREGDTAVWRFALARPGR
jgi:RimJ/RimL family protein N-acetyltransferase